MADRSEQRRDNFLRQCLVIAEMATCPRAHHGALVVDRNNFIVASGYNGSLPGEPHCDEAGCDLHFIEGKPCSYCAGHGHANRVIDADPGAPTIDHTPCTFCHGTGTRSHCMRVMHAERNALMQAARRGVSVEGCAIYITGQPCDECVKHLKAAGLTDAYWPGSHRCLLNLT